MNVDRAIRTAIPLSLGLLGVAACTPTTGVALPEVGAQTGPQLPPMIATTPLRGVELLEERRGPHHRF